MEGSFLSHIHRQGIMGPVATELPRGVGGGGGGGVRCSFDKLG